MAKDITGQMFGYLKAIRKTDKVKRTYAVWEMECTLCGKCVKKSLEDLKTAKSCGCYRKEIMSRTGKEREKDRKSRRGIPNTTSILRKQPNKNNKSGVRGVYWKKDKKRWVAQICINKKNYNLGSYKNIEKAVAIRKKAEEAIENNTFEQFIEEYKCNN